MIRWWLYNNAAARALLTLAWLQMMVNAATNAPVPVTAAPSNSTVPTPKPTTDAPTTTPSDYPSAAPSMHEAESAVLDDAMKAFASEFEQLSSIQAFDVAIPLIGMSLNDVMNNAGIYSAVNLTHFVTEKVNATDTSLVATEIETKLNEYVNEQTATTVQVHSNSDSALCPVLAKANPVTVDWVNQQHTEMSILFCLAVPYAASFALDPTGLFDASESSVLITTSSSMTVNASIYFAANLTVYFDGSGKEATFSMEPIIATANVGGSANLDLALGVLETTSTADVGVSVDYYVCFDVSDTSPCAQNSDSRLGNSYLYLSSYGAYSITGDLGVTEQFPGLTFPTNSSFTIAGEDILTNYVPTITVDNFPAFTELLRFSPSSLLRSLTQMESTLYRLQENERFLTTSIPLTETTMTKAVSTGSVLLANKHVVATPQLLKDRPKKSRTILSSSGFDANVSSSVNTTYSLVYTVGPDLSANPDDLDAVDALPESAVCTFTLSRDMTTADELVDDIVAGVNNASCGIKACRMVSAALNDCTRDDAGSSPTLDVRGGCNATCQVVMDTYTEGGETKMYLSSVVDSANTTDVVVLSLNQIAGVRQGATNLYGFPLNQPSFPELVPRYNSMSSFVDSLASAVTAQFENVAINFEYVPATEQEYSRLELHVGFGQTKNVPATWNPPNGQLGDFGSVAFEEAALDITAVAAFSTGFGFVLGPDDQEPLSVLGSACSTATETVFACDLEATQFNLTYTVGTGEPVSTVLTLAASSDTSAAAFLQSALDSVDISTFPMGIATVTEIGKNLLNIEFDASISELQLDALKDCVNVDDTNDVIQKAFSCKEGYLPVKITNSYGLEDQVTSKKSFQLMIAQSKIEANITAAGTATINANLNDVISVSSALKGDVKGAISLTAGQDQYTSYTTWVQDIVSLTNFNPVAEFDGSFTASVTALPPFDSSVEASGQFVNPYHIDFENPGAPDISFDVNLPGIGDVRFLTYNDVVTCMAFTQEFLVGDGSVETCSGGILDFQLFDQSIFFKKIPILGQRPCESLDFLKIYTDLIDYLVAEANSGVNTTFTALEEKLESALADVVAATGGTANVNFLTEVTEDAYAVRSSLTVDITLEWQLPVLEELGLSLNDILDNVEVTGDEITGAIRALIGDLIPADGFGQISFDGVLRFQSGIGLERTVELPSNVPNGTTAFEGTNCFVLGTSGLKMGFSGGTGGNVLGFDGMLGPFAGTFGIDLNFLDGGGSLSGLSLDVSLDPSLDYYIYSIDGPAFPDRLPTRASFEAVEGVTGLIGKLSGAWAGGIDGTLQANIPSIDVDLKLDMSFPDLQALFQSPKIAIFDVLAATSKAGTNTNTSGTLSFSVESFSSLSHLVDVNIPGLGNLMLGDGAYTNFVDAVQQFFNQIDSVTFGASGIITSIDVPFLKKKIATSLGAGSGGTSGSSVFKQAGAKIVGALDDALDTLVGELGGTIAAEVANLLNDVLTDYLVPEQSVEAICGCGDDGSGNFLSGDACPCEENDGSVVSIEWKIPLGATALSFEIPLDFELDENLALDLNFTQDNDEPVTLDVGWSFLFGFGYDVDTGVFIDTFPDSGSEVSIEAQLQVSSPSIEATLLNFLKAELTDTACQIAAGFFVDFDKVAGLRLAQEEVSTSRSYGRMSLSDFKGISTDFFQPSVRTAATFKTQMDLSVDDTLIGDAASYIPSLSGDVVAVLFKEIASSDSESSGAGTASPATASPAAVAETSQRQRKRASRDLAEFGRLSSGDHPARKLLNTMRSLAYTGILQEGYDFSQDFCALPEDDPSTGCLLVKDLTLDTNKLKDVFTPAIEIFVTSNDDGALDKLAQPLLPLNDPIPGVSDLTGKEMTILDAGEAYPKAAKGVAAVRLFLETYASIKTFVEDFEFNDGAITIADECDALAGFKCSGALFGDEVAEQARRLEVVEEAHGIFAKEDRAGFPMTPASADLRRQLNTNCPTDASAFDPDSTPACDVPCTDCAGKVSKAKCLKEKLKCKADSIEGLSFPFLADPTVLVGLISGDDFGLVEYAPSALEFALAAEFCYTLYTPPFVELCILLEFSSTFRYGVTLDSKGIREAVVQKEPVKALNSFAIMDLFDDVDEPILILSGAVGLNINANAVFLEVGLTATVGFTATADIFDPFPETSGGLVRPYELITYQGLDPVSWFEFTLSIYFELEMYIRVQIWLLFDTIVVYELSYSIREELIDPLVITPDAVTPIVEVQDGQLHLTASSEAATSGLACVSQDGSLGEETIECAIGDKFATGDAVSRLSLDDESSGRQILSLYREDGSASGRMILTGTTDASFTGIQSPIVLGDVGVLSLDYSASGTSILSSAAITIEQNAIQAGIASVKFTDIQKGVITLPFPEVQDLTTTLTSCNNYFNLNGHTNLVIKVDTIQAGCTLSATGGENEASVLIDFGTSSSCVDGNSITVSTNNGFTTIELFRASADASGELSKTFAFGPAFRVFEFQMSDCNDAVSILSTLSSTISVTVNGRAGGDTITVGDDTNGVNQIYSNLELAGGPGTDNLQVVDTPAAPSSNKAETLSSNFLQGFLPVSNNTFGFGGFETLDLKLSSTENSFTMFSTPLGSTTLVHGGASADSFTIVATKGNIVIDGGSGDDYFYVDSLYSGTTALLLGGHGADTLQIDGSPADANQQGSTLENTVIRWSGGNGDDLLQTYFVSHGDTTIEVFDDNDGVNQIEIDCVNFACYVLSRENFLANIHTPGSNSTTVERINLDTDTATIQSIVLRLNGGLNEMFFDDTMAKMDVYGGPDKDSFHVGQKYNSLRDAMAGVKDEITTTLTTQGYLSDGNSHSLIINGQGGGDYFDVLRNKQLLDLNGDSGDDSFVIRSFLALRIVDGEVQASDAGDVNAVGGEDNDYFEIGDTVTSYVVNSGVDVDGGTGNDRAVIVGTEADDTYVVKDGEVLGGGLSITFSNIESLDVTGAEGNDKFQILSTGPEVITSVYGALGSDTFLVAPRSVDPVISKNFKGHTGVLEHDLSSPDDAGYDGLLIEGIGVNVMDNDVLGYIHVVETSASYFLTEDDDGLSFDFYLFPTKRPQAPVMVDVGSQFDINGEPYVILTDEKIGDTGGIISISGVLQLTWGVDNMSPKRISVKHNSKAKPLTITDYNGLISIDLSTLTEDTNFTDTEQTIQPIYSKLIPRKDGSSNAKSVTIIEPTGDTVVAEGGAHGFNSTYDVYLRPCTAEMKSDTKLAIQESVAEQVVVTPSVIFDSDWGDDCKVTVSVTAVEDEDEEGLHFVTLGHTVEDSNGSQIILSDGSTLLASNVLVKIFDDDIAGVIIEESLGRTSTVEIDDTDRTDVDGSQFSSLLEDSYKVRLSKAPNSTVTIKIDGIATASDDPNQLGGLVSNEEIALRTTPRIQANVRVSANGIPANSTTIMFTPDDWFEWKTVYVSAVNDDITEGVDLLNFPSQPSYLSLIQGPLTIAGSDSPDVPAIADPLMLPGESDSEEFEVPDRYTVDVSAFDAIEEKQVNHLIINNLDVRGTMPSVGYLRSDQFHGMNMGQNLIVAGSLQRDGIVYKDMDLIEINLGEGVDEIMVENTTSALHYLNLAAGDDRVRIKSISGPFVIHGGEGTDSVYVTSDAARLDEIGSLLAFDGGTSEEDADHLTLDNAGDADGADQVLNVTRNLVEVATMTVHNESNAPQDNYLINLRGAANGSYVLEISESVNSTVSSQTLSVPFSASAKDLEGLIQDTLFPDEAKSTCGTGGITACSQSVKVYEIGSGFLISFIGERLNQGVSLTMVTDSLENFAPEMFQNWTNDVLERSADVTYGNVEVLDITMGEAETVLNIRGTSAATTIKTQASDDYVFISSEANQNIENAQSVDFLHGHLDYFHENLTVAVGEGRHRLMVSDESSHLSMGSLDSPALLTSTSLTNMKEGVGNIHFSAAGGHWSDGVNFWLGKNDDYLSVTSVPSNDAHSGLRTATSVHAGTGDDVLEIALDKEEHPGAVFIANGQHGNDRINGTASSLPLILFGDEGDDELTSGSGSDIVFGDYGRVFWKAGDNESVTIAAAAGGGGYGDFTDGVIRYISEVISVASEQGGNDTITLLGGDDVGIGGFANDTIDGGDGRDIVFGDAAQIVYFDGSASPYLLSSIDCAHGGFDLLYGGPGAVDYLVGGGFGDEIWGNDTTTIPDTDESDLIFGDHAQIVLWKDPPFKLLLGKTTFENCTGGDDFIIAGPGDDIAFGGAHSDFIEGNEGQDLIFGDFGVYADIAPYPKYKCLVDFPKFGGNDTILGGPDDDIIFGQEGSDLIYGNAGRDDITGGHNVPYGQDGGDMVHGGNDADTIIGDNGQILRGIVKIGSTFPWDRDIVWDTYPAPFNDEVIHEVRLFDDLDNIGGDDRLYGDHHNDLIWGQRGNDEIHGGDGEDELVGGLGEDKLFAGKGNDILLGEVGYAVRRVNKDGSPRLNSNTKGASSKYVWHKDIVLQEVGRITSSHLISKTLNTTSLKAENISSSSMMFVANEFNGNGQVEDPARGGWPTELILFELGPGHHDELHCGHGSSICIGQRGDDWIKSGSGLNLLIGDSGTNTIGYDTDLPKIYEVYRALEAPEPFVVPEFGAVFSVDYKLFPSQYRQVDSLASLIDTAVNMNDLQAKSDLLHDIIGISALKKKDSSACLQPMLGVVPGFLRPEQRLHGNDEIISGSGHSIVVGDDIRGFSGFDLSQFSDIELVRKRLDSLVFSLGARLSTLEVDTERSGFSNDADADISVGCDTIETDPKGHAVVTGDSLTLIGRTYKADGVDSSSLMQITKDVMNRFYDIELILVDLHFALYEVHHDLLERAIAGNTTNPNLGVELHKLKLADDNIKSNGKDIVVGDAATLFVQAHRPGTAGFEFKGMGNGFDQNIERALHDIKTRREAERDKHARADLKATGPLHNQERKKIPFADVPFKLSVGEDEIKLNKEHSLAVGDFALFGGVVSTENVVNQDLSDFVKSVETLRKRPVVSLNKNNLNVFGYGINFYNGRFDTQTAKKLEPAYHGDSFHGNSSSNVIIGDYWASYGYEQSTGETFRVDAQSNAFGQWDNARWTMFEGDTIDVVPFTKVAPQKGQDKITGGAVRNDKLEAELAFFMKTLMQDHLLFVQFKLDVFSGVIPHWAVKDVKDGFQCVDPNIASFIPPFVLEPGTSMTIEMPTRSPTTPTTAPVTAPPATAAPFTAAPKPGNGQGNGNGNKKDKKTKRRLRHSLKH